ncbi:MAG: tRNA (N6-isopentenyl adenosine(37)-C2)-methylthiotransferase MiaB [Negativicutes bacterium]|jgi:tRNA-2-methylthio-N6-dimethylallyladenosine synthase
MFYHIQTHGCQMNENDSENLAGQLHELGYQNTTDIETADCIVINTCCIRESAEKKIHGKIGELKRLKKERPSLINIITGCMAQKNADNLLKKYAHIDIVLGPQNIEYLSDALVAAQNGERINHTSTEIRRFTQNHEPARFDKTAAYVPIMHGCNNFCSYCIVPYVRGREISRSSSEILDEIRSIITNGYKEIVLLGQNVNSYGKESVNEMSFAQLLAAIDNIPGIDRLRYMTSHPRDMSGEVIDVIANSHSITKHFHLPAQAGNDEILRLMNRGYTAAEYLNLIKKIRDVVPDATITTDIIVGFPGETEEMFNDTLKLMRAAEFDLAYTFIYSQRSGTPAASMPNQIALPEKKRRLQQLMAVQNEISLKKNRDCVGNNELVSVEGPSKKDASVWTGRTSGNKIVHWTYQGTEQVGSTINVKITAAQTWLLRGELI